MILWTSDTAPRMPASGAASRPEFAAARDRRYHNDVVRLKWGGLDFPRLIARSGWSTAAWRQRWRGGQA